MAGSKTRKQMASEAAEPDAAESKRGVAAVDRALSILAAFDSQEPSLSLSRIAQRTGLYKSTTLRLIDSLEAAGYIRRLANGDYQLGPTLFRLGMLYRQSFNLADFAMPILQELTRETNESSSLYVRDGQARLCLFRVDSNQVLREHVRPGDKLPLRQGAAGRILTHFEAGVAAARKANAAGKLTAVSLGERQTELAAVASPVFSASGELAGAISVSGAKIRFTDDVVKRFTKSVLRSARALTEALGGDTTVFPPA